MNILRICNRNKDNFKSESFCLNSARVVILTCFSLIEYIYKIKIFKKLQLTFNIIKYIFDKIKKIYIYIHCCLNANMNAYRL